MSLAWSITDPAKGARTVDEITEKAKLGKRNKKKKKKDLTCRAPMFSFIPMHCVVIDSRVFYE